MATIQTTSVSTKQSLIVQAIITTRYSATSIVNFVPLQITDFHANHPATNFKTSQQ